MEPDGDAASLGSDSNFVSESKGDDGFRFSLCLAYPVALEKKPMFSRNLGFKKQAFLVLFFCLEGNELLSNSSIGKNFMEENPFEPEEREMGWRFLGGAGGEDLVDFPTLPCPGPSDLRGRGLSLHIFGRRKKAEEGKKC
jgi:hypothetical protein